MLARLRRCDKVYQKHNGCIFRSIYQTQIAGEESITTIVVVKFGMISKPYGGSHMRATRGK